MRGLWRSGSGNARLLPILGRIERGRLTERVFAAGPSVERVGRTDDAGVRRRRRAAPGSAAILLLEDPAGADFGAAGADFGAAGA